ncbi:MAG TPA: hypothetical protein VLI67_08080, partial [Vicinamibacteria bacterium]|nr:hypothetical protein [Vicinamibacteria bacterium]
MTRRPCRLSASSAVALGTLLTASGLHAQSPSPSPSPAAQNPVEVVYSTNSSKKQILRLDFATGTGTVVNTDAALRKQLGGLAARNDGSTVHLLVCDSKRGEVLFYEDARGAGRVITSEIPFPDSVSLDLGGDAYVVQSKRGDDDRDEGDADADDDGFYDGEDLDDAVDDGKRATVWRIPRDRHGSRPGGYGAPFAIDRDVPSKRLEDTRVVPFTAGLLRQGD